jgi:DNA polymerase-3 subunit epsilon
MWTQRFVALDLELTGLDIEGGDRIISIGASEIINGGLTGRSLKVFANPCRKSTAQAFAVHGIHQSSLDQHPPIEKILPDVLKFLEPSLIIHHCWYRADDTSTDERAMHAELQRAGFDVFPHDRWLNIKKWAQHLSPEENSLNDMLARYKIEERRNEFHCPDQDARLTAQVFLKMLKDPALAAFTSQRLLYPSIQP